jgi:NAD(P)-dependent dehydrogenase (short-subunit alcohol dehydrogenase family)
VTRDFDGRVALVTGGTRGIGFAIAAELAARGARVVVTGRKATELDDAVVRLGGSGTALGVRGAADDEAHQAEAVERAVTEFGSVDLLVNNAAVNPQYGPLVDADLAAVRKVLEVNVTSCLAWIQHASRASMSQRGGSVLNVASIGGLRVESGLGAYNTSKSALVHLTRQLAVELAPRVRVNAIAPGIVKTTFARALYEHDEPGVAATYPMNRLGAPTDIATASAFLLSEQASWITRECMVVDGGVTL